MIYHNPHRAEEVAQTKRVKVLEIKHKREELRSYLKMQVTKDKELEEARLQRYYVLMGLPLRVPKSRSVRNIHKSKKKILHKKVVSTEEPSLSPEHPIEFTIHNSEKDISHKSAKEIGINSTNYIGNSLAKTDKEMNTTLINPAQDIDETNKDKTRQFYSVQIDSKRNFRRFLPRNTPGNSPPFVIKNMVPVHLVGSNHTEGNIDIHEPFAPHQHVFRDLDRIPRPKVYSERMNRALEYYTKRVRRDFRPRIDINKAIEAQKALFQYKQSSINSFDRVLLSKMKYK